MEGDFKGKQEGGKKKDGNNELGAEKARGAAWAEEVREVCYVIVLCNTTTTTTKIYVETGDPLTVGSLIKRRCKVRWETCMGPLVLPSSSHVCSLHPMYILQSLPTYIYISRSRRGVSVFVWREEEELVQN